MQMKKIIKVFAFCIILVLLLSRIYTILSWKDTAGDYYSSTESLYKLEDDLVDVLFLGSSHCYCSINNSVLWEEHGISSFSMAISGQDLASSYYCLVEALKTQSPKVVCLELYGVTFHGYGAESNMYRNTLSLKLSKNAVDAANSIAGERAGELLLKWPIIHTRYAELKEQDFATKRPAYLGYHAEFNTQGVDPLCTYFGDEMIEIAAEEEEWLRKIITLTEENEIELVLFAAPIVSSEEDQKMLNYVAAIGEEYGIPLINMPRMQEELQMNPGSDYIDWAHTNYYGAGKASRYMGKYLKDNYELTDRRGDERYDIWYEDAKIRKHEYQNYMFAITYDISEYLGQLAGAEDYTVIITTDGEFYSDAVEIGDYLSVLGLEDFYEGTGAWVIDNGEVVVNSTEDNFFEHLELNGSDLVVSRTDCESNIVIDKQAYNKVQNGINVVIYDNLLEQVVDAVGFDALNQYAVVK